MGLWMLDAQGSSNVDETTLATTLILKASSTHWDQGVKAKILRIEDVAYVGASSWHTAWVAVHDLYQTEVGVIQVYRQGDLLARSVLVDMVGCSYVGRISTGEVADKLAKCHVSNKCQTVHLTVTSKDRTNQSVEGAFADCGRDDRARRSAVSSRNWVGRLSGGVDPLAKTTHTVRSASTVLNRHLVVGGDGCFDVAFNLTHGLRFCLCHVCRTDTGDSLLEVGHNVVTAHELDVVSKTGAIRELVGERGNVGTFADTRGSGCGEGVNSPLGVGGRCFTLAAERKDRSLLWSKDGKLIAEILAVGDSGTRAGFSGGG